MKNTTSFSNSFVNMMFILVIIFSIFYFMMPQSYDKTEAPLSEFSTKRAFQKVQEIALKPHYVGSKNHPEVISYLFTELKNLGLEPFLQEGFTMTERGTLVYCKNILAKINGTTSTKDSKALLLLSHYDSAPHSYSLGASDDGNGIAVILESVRAFLHKKNAKNVENKNDIIILFSDAEEVGLNGAALFVTQHKWAKNVGVVLNLEARGTSGPGYMLMETNNGNKTMTEHFAKSKLTFPVSNSLMYSIYKMLPNDTDLTVFREKGNIQGYNFAFIDDHFNYHTAQDDAQHLNKNSLAHQGTYVFPLLNYFANTNLNNLNSTEDHVYFNVPFSFIHYPFSWILPMLILTIALFIGFTFIGFGKQVLRINMVLKGFIPLLSALLISGLLAFVGWNILLKIYPQYGEMLHGFTYNGHNYIYAFVCITLAICFFIYRNDGKYYPEMNHLIAPLLLWIIICSIVAFYLKGASFFVIPVLFTILSLGYFVITQKSNTVLNLLFSIPALVLFVPLIQMLPIGLGLKMLSASTILTVLTFTLLLPIFGKFKNKSGWGILFMLISFAFFGKAHFESGFEKGKGKPNSLLYVLNGDTNKANWATYDTHLDSWTKGYLGEKPLDALPLNTNKLYSKYGSSYTFMANAPYKNIPKPNIEFLKDSTNGIIRNLKIKITPNRAVNRYDVFNKGNYELLNFKANGVKSLDIKSNIIAKKTNKVLSYYVTNNMPLEMEFSIKASQKLDLELIESSFDLMENPLFSISKRSEWMIPKPFVLTDAIVVKQKVRPQIIVDSTATKPILASRIIKNSSPTININNETSN